MSNQDNESNYKDAAIELAAEIDRIVGDSQIPVVISYKSIMNSWTGKPVVSKITELESLGGVTKHFRAFREILQDQYRIGIAKVNQHLFTAFNVNDAQRIRMTNDRCRQALIKLGQLDDDSICEDTQEKLVSYCQGKAGSPALGIIACPVGSKANHLLLVPLARTAKTARTTLDNCREKLEVLEDNGIVESKHISGVQKLISAG